MDRGERQGCPLSPLLFILTIELLARNIRNDDKIKGIRISDSARAIKIKQYADDTTLFLNDLIDYREILSKIKLFSLFSGLYLNTNKSYALSLGNKDLKGKVKFGIKFVNQIKILGIIFSNELRSDQLAENYDSRIDNLLKTCASWSKRDLSILGKITVLKTYGISQFVYLMQSIGIDDDRLEEINRIFFRFLWKRNFSNQKAHERVKRKTMVRSKKDGGLDMIDIKKMQESIFLTWVERLISAGNEDWKSAPLFYFGPLGGLNVFRSTVGPGNFQGKDLIKSVFWRRALDVWLTNSLRHDKSVLANGTHLQGPLFNSKFIMSNSNPLFLPYCIQKGICCIGDMIYNDTREIISFNQFENIYGRRGDTFLTYHVLYNSLRRMSDNFKFSTMIESNKFLFHEIEVGQIGRRGFYKIIMSENCHQHVEALWKRKYDIDLASAWILPFKVTKETKLQILQWKIFHNIYPTGILLEKMHIKPNSNCDTCNTLDTLEHFFFECLQIRCLWHEVELMIAAATGKTFKLDAKLVLFGFNSSSFISIKVLNFINHIILVGKMCISKLKYGKKHGSIIPLFEFERQLRQI